MQKEEYRRSLIMLRSLLSDLSGHVRLERRTLMGTLTFALTGGGGPAYQGFMLGRVNGRTRGAKLGGFGEAVRGQSGLLFRFDPRNIEGLPLSRYEVVGVAKDGQLALFGNLNGSVNWPLESLSDAVTRLFARTQVTSPSVMELPAAEEAPPAVEHEDAPADAAQIVLSDVLDVPAQEAKQSAPTALDVLGLAPDAFPEGLGNLARLFAGKMRDSTLDVEGYVFVRSDMSAAPGWCLIGLSADGGAPDSVCYAIPATDGQAEPPAGLESYQQVEGQDGTAYWVNCVDVKK